MRIEFMQNSTATRKDRKEKNGMHLKLSCYDQREQLNSPEGTL